MNPFDLRLSKQDLSVSNIAIQRVICHILSLAAEA